MGDRSRKVGQTHGPFTPHLMYDPSMFFLSSRQSDLFPKAGALFFAENNYVYWLIYIFILNTLNFPSILVAIS